MKPVINKKTLWIFVIWLNLKVFLSNCNKMDHISKYKCKLVAESDKFASLKCSAWEGPGQFFGIILHS